MKKKLTSTTILKETQLDSLKESLPASLGAELVGLLDRSGISIEKTTRFMSVQARCQKARSARGLSIRETANRLGIPQYQLKDIEAGRFKGHSSGCP